MHYDEFDNDHFYHHKHDDDDDDDLCPLVSTGMRRRHRRSRTVWGQPLPGFMLLRAVYR